MGLSLAQSRTISSIAKSLYDFLPGSGNARWRGHVTFRTVAEKVGVSSFVISGSKEPMIVALLERTLTERRDRFEPLIVEIVRAGIRYRQRQQPIQSLEIRQLNGLLLELGFKFPDLWDSDLLDSLSTDDATRSGRRVDLEVRDSELLATRESDRVAALAALSNDFIRLHGESDRQRAGLELERILNRLFDVSDLSPREAFRVTGEQIDGSFELDYEIYLVEAKWEKVPLSEQPLLVFRGKIEGKSAFTRGLLLALNGVTAQAKEAIVRGKQPNFFIMDGHDLMMILSNSIRLLDFLRCRQRLLAEEGAVSIPFGCLSRT